MKHIVNNQSVLELIQLIENYGLIATPVIYNAFYKSYFEGNIEISQLLEEYHHLSQADIEMHLRKYLSDKNMLNSNLSELSKNYSDAAHYFITQSHLQNKQYKSEIHNLKVKNKEYGQKDKSSSNLDKNNIENIENSRLLFESKIRDYEKIIQTLQARINEVQETANRDYLTGVFNRLSYDQTLALWLDESRNNNKPLCLAIFDIDFFKKFNDKYGHLIGDQVLTHFAKILQNEVRYQDYVSRYGGEEFTVLFPDTTLKNAQQICERIRTKIESRPLNSRETSVKIDAVTVSCGITQANNNDTEQSLFKRADNYLYKAKQMGRNRIEIDTMNE